MEYQSLNMRSCFDCEERYNKNMPFGQFLKQRKAFPMTELAFSPECWVLEECWLALWWRDCRTYNIIIHPNYQPPSHPGASLSFTSFSTPSSYGLPPHPLPESNYSWRFLAGVITSAVGGWRTVGLLLTC